MLATATRSLALAPKATARRSCRSMTVRASSEHINPSVRKSEDKVVDTIVVPTDLGGKPQVAMCRCWRSKTFPNCDGSHVAHNKATGDNVGPLLVKAEK